MRSTAHTETRQVRLFVEELCADLVRFIHVSDGLALEDIKVQREVRLRGGTFADISVQPPGQQSYYVEVNYGYTRDQTRFSLRRKYGSSAPGSKVILVVEESSEDLEAELRSVIHEKLDLEIWSEKDLLLRIEQCFGLKLESLEIDMLASIRQSVDHAKWRHAFGEKLEGHPLQTQLLWHYGFWRLRQLHEQYSLPPDEVILQKTYHNVVVLMADLCSFSSYVRDTADERVVRAALTGFYSKARYAIINNGGMLYQFVGDEVIGIFGIPETNGHPPGDAINCAKALVDIGDSVADEWQRSIDRVQSAHGVHIGIGMGDLTVLGLRPFDPGLFGVFGDTINLTARLMSAARSGEVMISNTLYNHLLEEDQSLFARVEPLEGRNVGMIQGWLSKLTEKPGVSVPGQA
jgi:adenylate cyclase